MPALKESFDSPVGDSVALRVLRGYMQRVAAGLGVEPESTWCEVDSPANAYIALEERAPHRRQHDMALVWDEQHGWAAAVETHSGEDLMVLAYFGEDSLPAPAEVVAFTKLVLAGEPVGTHDPPRCHTGDLAGRLARSAAELC